MADNARFQHSLLDLLWPGWVSAVLSRAVSDLITDH